jgi:type IV pilus assembly protein PilM
MKKNQQLIFNCGTSHVTAAVVSMEDAELKLHKVYSEPLTHDFSDDDAWLDALTLVLRQMVGEYKLSGSATFILPGHQLLTKTLRIPHVEPSKRAQIIAFEAQQNIPYPLNEVVWDTQVVGDDGVETEVLFIAGKADMINRFCVEVSGFGLVVEAISAATVLEYNALRFNQKAAQAEETLLINIGARSSNLSFCGANGLFVRNIQLGGNSLTQSIADGIGKTFTTAEALKVKLLGEHSGGSSEDSIEGGRKMIDSATDAFMRRLSQEVTRSIVNYRRQRGGKAPKRILLTGRGSLILGLSAFLAEKQSMDVESFDPLEAIIVDEVIDTEAAQLRLNVGEIIGEAVRPILEDAAGVNLLPEAIQSEIAFARKKPFLAMAGLLLAIAPFPAWIAHSQKAEQQQVQTVLLENQIAPFRQLSGAIADKLEQAQVVRSTIERVEDLANAQSNWIEFMSELQESLTRIEDVWLDEMRVNRQLGAKASYTVSLRGRMLLRETVDGSTTVDEDRLARRIQTLIDSFVESRFVLSAGAPNISWTSITEGLNVLPFSIDLVIDPTKPL